LHGQQTAEAEVQLNLALENNLQTQNEELDRALALALATNNMTNSYHHTDQAANNDMMDQPHYIRAMKLIRAL